MISHLHNWLAYLSEMIEFRIDRSVNRIETNGVARAQHKRVIGPGVDNRAGVSRATTSRRELASGRHLFVRRRWRRSRPEPARVE